MEYRVEVNRYRSEDGKALAPEVPVRKSFNMALKQAWERRNRENREIDQDYYVAHILDISNGVRF